MTGYEAAPFFKRGGLGDVLGSLPIALKAIGVDARVVIPYYEQIRQEFEEKKIGEFLVHFEEGEEQISVYQGNFPGSDIIAYFLSNKPNLDYFKNRGRNKKIDQFAFFDLAVAKFISWLIKNKHWGPDLIHCNDWHTGLIPLILNRQLKLAIPTLLTIHNLSYQGKGSIKVLDLLHIKDEDARELKRGTPATEINILGEGIMHATVVSTVSVTYAKEISQNNDHDPIGAFLLKRQKEKGRKDEIFGIVNGIDYEVWNPKTDAMLAARGKEKNKQYLLKTLGLSNKITFCFIGRMASQKGIDVVLKRIDEIISLGVNIIFLGSGEKPIENSILRAIKKYPNNIRADFSYNEKLAHQLYGGADFILIPSHFEPCGLIQMIAMRYGTLPIASKTGGLQDTISDGKNGFLFKNGSSVGLVKAIKRAVGVYNNSQRHQQMVEVAMHTDFSWNKSALLYKKLYLSIV